MKPADMDTKVRRRRILVLAIGGAFLASAIVVYFNEKHKLSRDNISESQGGETGVIESSLPVVRVDRLLQHLTKDIGGNPLAFNSRYSNTRYRFTAPFLSAFGPIEGNYEMILDLFDLWIPCVLPKSQRAELETIGAGDTVEASGIPYMTGPMQVVFYDCRIISVRKS